MSNEQSFLKLRHSGAPNPDRASNTRKRQERIQRLMASSDDQDKWWLEMESGMLTSETLASLMEWQKEKTT